MIWLPMMGHNSSCEDALKLVMKWFSARGSFLLWKQFLGMFSARSGLPKIMYVAVADPAVEVSGLVLNENFGLQCCSHRIW